MMAVGVASPSAQGQAMMSTATKLVSASGSRVAAGAKPNHIPNVMMAKMITVGTNTALTRSASR